MWARAFIEFADKLMRSTNQIFLEGSMLSLFNADSTQKDGFPLLPVKSGSQSSIRGVSASDLPMGLMRAVQVLLKPKPDLDRSSCKGC